MATSADASTSELRAAGPGQEIHNDGSIPTDPAAPEADFLSNILTPGSSLHPTLLLIVDCAFALLTLVLIAMTVVTRNIHLVALTCIDLGLWGSVKWFVSELKKMPMLPTEEEEVAPGRREGDMEEEEKKQR